MKKPEKSAAWTVVMCAVLAAALTGNWIWVTKTYVATYLELLMPMSVPNTAMFGALLGWVVFAFALVMAFETDDESKVEAEKEAKLTPQEGNTN